MKMLSSYFPHDSNAKDDPKCVLLIEQLGMEGYGIYWMLIETLREQPDYRYPLNLLPALARRYNTTAEKVKAVVCSYGLFQIENNEFFFSHSLIKRMEPLEAKRLIASKAGKASAEKRKINACSTPVQHPFNEGSTSKVNKSKVNKNIKESPNGDKKETSVSSPASSNPEFIKFQEWMKSKAPYCSNPKNFPSQITEAELLKLKEKYTGQEVADIIEQIENRKDLRKRYTNLYRTVLNWAKKEYGK